MSETLLERPPLRVGVVGVGREVLLRHAPILKALPEEFTVTAACDLVKEHRDVLQRDFFPKAKQYRQVSDMLDDESIDVVLVSLPTADHASCALECLNRGRWTVVDNPLAVTHESAMRLKAVANGKARGHLLPGVQGLFSNAFRMAKSVLADPRLGDVFEVRVRAQTYVRRDDWQAVKRCFGGATWYGGVDAVMQAMALMPLPPSQMWGDLKRVAALGDAEDYIHLMFKTRGPVSADVEVNGGQLPPFEPAITVRGSRGSFIAPAGAAEGFLRVIDPAHKFPRRRASVRTPPVDDMSEPLPVVDIPVTLPADAGTPGEAFWRAVARTVRTAAPFPVDLDAAVEAIRYLQLAKANSLFAQ